MLNVFRHAWWPYDTVLGRVPDLEGFHHVRFSPRAPVPGGPPPPSPADDR
ncbi:hypothetical protein [Streptomyces sp. NPDC001307]